MKTAAPKPPRVPVPAWVLPIALAWTLLIVSFLTGELLHERATTRRIAAMEARANFNKDQAIRLWATTHGGVYEPVDTNTPPSPYLTHVPERDLETPSGRRLTLMNPAYMLRQMMGDYSALYGVSGHLTSLKPLRPENAPDAWETNALKAFETGVKEVSEFTEIKGEPYLRLMRPMTTQEGCLKCHARQGYQVGDVRGGVGISLPMQPLLAAQRAQSVLLAVVHGVIWGLGLAGLSVGSGLIRRRIAERLGAEATLRESEVKFRTIIESSPVALAINDAQGNITYLNRYFLDTFGYSRAEIPTVAEWWPRAYPDPAYRQRVMAEWQAAIAKAHREGTALQLQDYDVTCKDGTVRNIHFSLAPMGASHVVVLHDLTEQKRTAAALRASQEQFQAFFEQANVGMSLTQLSGATQTNQAFCQLLGYSLAELRGKTWQELTHPEDIEPNEREIGALLSGTRATTRFTKRYLHKQGQVVWGDLSTTLRRDAAGQPLYFLTAVVNITGHKQAEAELHQSLETAERARQTMLSALEDRRQVEDALRISEAQLAHAMAQAQLAYWEMDAATRTFTFNDQFYALYATTAAREGGYQMPAETYAREFLPPDEQQLVPHDAARLLSGELEEFKQEHRIRRRDGELRHIVVRVTVVRDATGRVVGTRGSNQDITGHKQAEEKLARAAELLEVTGALAKVGGWEVNLETMKLSWTRETFRIAELEPPVEPPLEQGINLFAPEARPTITAAIQAAIATGTPYDLKLPLITAQGRPRWVQTQGFAKMRDGKAVRLYGTFQDITERRQAEAALFRSRQLLAETERLGRMGGWEFNIDEGKVTWTEELYRIHEVEFTGQPSVEQGINFYAPASQPIIEAALRRAVEQGEPWDLDLEIITAKGNLRSVHVIGKPDLAHRRIYGFFQDITERKRAEAELAAESQRRRVLFDQSPVGIVVLDPQTGKFVDFNAMAPEQLGYSREEFSRLTLADVEAVQTSADMQQAIAEALRRKTADFETQHRTRQGELRDTHVRASLVEVQGRKLFQSVWHDITERKRAEERLRNVSAYTRSLIEASLDPLVTINSAGQITDVNDASVAATGVPRDQLLGTDFSEYFTEPATARDGYQRVFSEGFVRDYPLALRHVSGRVTEVLYNATLYHDAQGQVGGVFAAARDVTARKRAEAEIRQLNAELEQRVSDRTRELTDMNRELESFAYSVSHDLRAPLRAIDGFSRMLLDDHAQQLDAAGQDSLRRVRAATQRMGQLIDDLLMLSRISREAMQLRPVDLSALARDVAGELEQAAPGRQVTWDIAPEVTVTADARLLRVLLENLLGNAWKFTSKQPAARIAFGHGEHRGVPACFVRDNGAGFDMAYADKLFGAFQRLHTASEFPGTGIGLATVQRIIHRHGGQVWAEAQVGQGATFYFTLPPPPTLRESDTTWRKKQHENQNENQNRTTQ